MKIVYIAKFSEFYHTGNYVAHAFKSIGVDVIKVPPDTGFETTTKIILENKPDFVLYGKSLKHKELVPWLKKNKILSVFWLYDMAWGNSPVVGTNRKHIFDTNIHLSDLFFSTDGGHDNEWLSVGVEHNTLRQGIHAPDHLIMQQENMGFDILFVGHPYFTLRKQMIHFLKNRYGDKFKHVEQGLRGIELNKAVRSAKIVIADSYPSPRYWSNRVYEMIGRGGFVIHSYVDGLSEEFAPGRDIITFPYSKNFDLLKTTIDYYLEDSESRGKIMNNGFERCPTYEDRVKEMLSYINGAK